MNELAIKKLGHAKSFADFAEERQEFDFAKPIVVIENLGVLWGMSDLNDLLREGDFVLGDFVETLKVALDSILRVTNLASRTANKIIRSISMANKACAHHEGSKMANVQRICAWIGTPIEIAWSFV